MKVLLDHNVPAQLKPLLKDHTTSTARELGWDRLANGGLLSAAEAAGFGILITGDRNLAYQQNNSRRSVSLVVVTDTKLRVILTYFQEISAALSRASPGSYEVVSPP